MRRVLLIIDLQKGFVKEQTKEVPTIVGSITTRNRFDVVIQTRWVNNSTSHFISKLFYRGVSSKEEAALCLDLPGAKVLTRCRYSAWDRSLEKLLREDDQIYIVGLETDACILATCFSLFDNGHSFKVVRDAIATNRTDLQEPVLSLMLRNFGKDVLVSSDNLAWL